MIIFYFVPYFPPNSKGGAEISLELLASELVRKGHEVHIFTPNYNKPDKEICNGYIVHFIGWGKEGVWSLNNPLSLYKTFRNVQMLKIKPTIIDSYNWPLAAWFVAKQLRKPYVLSIRDLTPLSDLRVDFFARRYSFLEYFKSRFDNFGFSLIQIAYGLYGYTLTQITHKILRGANGLTFASKALMVAYKKFNENSIAINSIVVGHAKQIDQKRKMQVLYIARLSKGKGFNFLLEAVKSYIDKKKFKKLSFVFIGDGVEPKLASKYKKKIKFLGKLSHDRVLTQIGQSRVVVVPSIVFDAMPRAILESLSLGTPVVATDVGGSPEALGNGGILIKINDRSGLESAILKLSSDDKLWMELSKNGLSHIKKFSPRIVASRVERFYEKVLL